MPPLTATRSTSAEIQMKLPKFQPVNKNSAVAVVPRPMCLAVRPASSLFWLCAGETTGVVAITPCVPTLNQGYEKRHQVDR